MNTYHPKLMPSNSSQSEPPSAFSVPARISGPSKTLLVVDDEPLVREVETEILRWQGYTVLEAANAAEALRMANATRTIHLLLTDFWMPDIDGLELARRFRAVHPKTPVLMVSGSLPLLQDRAEELDHLTFLPKPFHFGELLHKVRALLDAATPLPIRKPWHCD
jgi:two-component system, cell cycle sensor histidine kinase and response regulator CckA